MKVLDSIWFTQMGGSLIGIAKVQTEYDGVKYYIGTGSGMDQETDAMHIAETGAKFPIEAGEAIFGK